MNPVEKQVLDFWNPQDLRSVIVSPIHWDAEIPIHMDQVFNIPQLPQDWSSLRFLEIGCGIGRLVKEVSKKANWAYGVDISKSMIAESKNYLAESTRAETIQINLDGYIPLEASTLDVVYSFLVFQHLHTREIVNKYITEARRLLRPGGIFRVQNHIGKPFKDGKFHNFTGEMFESVESFANEVERHGLKVVDTNTGLGCKQWIWITAIKQ